MHDTAAAEPPSVDVADVIRQHSRSFSIASRLLPARHRTLVHGLYAWCRTADDAVDAAGNEATAERTLQVLEQDLERMQQGQATEHPASVWIRPLIVSRSIEVQHAQELIAGMRMDLRPLRLACDTELQRYCYHAAGTVGLMMTRLMGVQDPAADRHAIALGVAMQLTNIARDVREDALRGRSYLPGLPEPLSADPRVVRAAVGRVLAQAESEYLIAADGLHFLSRDCRLAIRLAMALYREIGRQIQRNDCRVLHGRTVVGKLRLVWIVVATLIKWLAAELRQGSTRYAISISKHFQEYFMSDSNPVPANRSMSTVGQAKHAVYLGLSLTSIMAAALFVMVFINPKDASYSYLPLAYSAGSLLCGIVFNRLAARCEIGPPSSIHEAQ